VESSPSCHILLPTPDLQLLLRPYLACTFFSSRFCANVLCACKSFIRSFPHSFIHSVSQSASHWVGSWSAPFSSKWRCQPLEWPTWAGPGRAHFLWIWILFLYTHFSSPIHALLLVGVEIVVQIRVGATPLLIPGDFEWIGRKSINK